MSVVAVYLVRDGVANIHLTRLDHRSQTAPFKPLSSASMETPNV